MTISAEDESGSESESTGLVVQHALSADSTIHGQWIVDSGATCHMCNSPDQFSSLQALCSPLTATLSDGHALQAAGHRNVMKLPQAKNQERTLQDVLFVPDLAYNLLSVTSAAKRGKVTTFFESMCEIKDAKSRMVASGHREGSLYYLDYEGATQQVHSIRSNEIVKKGTIWHRRFGHLGVQSLQSLAKGSMVVGLDLDRSEEFDFCEL